MALKLPLCFNQCVYEWIKLNIKSLVELLFHFRVRLLPERSIGYYFSSNQGLVLGSLWNGIITFMTTSSPFNQLSPILFFYAFPLWSFPAFCLLFYTAPILDIVMHPCSALQQPSQADYSSEITRTPLADNSNRTCIPQNRDVKISAMLVKGLAFRLAALTHTHRSSGIQSSFWLLGQPLHSYFFPSGCP